MIQNILENPKSINNGNFNITFGRNKYAIEITNITKYQQKQFNCDLLQTCSPILMASIIMLFVLFM